MMQQSSRRPPQYPTPATPAPQRPPAKAGVAKGSPPPPSPAPTYRARATRDVVVRSPGLKLLSILGILHASMILMTLVVVLVMALGGDARVGLVITTIKNTGMLLWTWTLFAIFTSFVLGFVM